MRPTLPGLLLACLAATMPPGCRNQPGQNSQAAGGATPARGQRAAAVESNPSKPHPAGPHRTPAAAGSRSRQLSKVAPPKPHPKAPAGQAPKAERVQRRQTAQQSAAALRAGTERPPGTEQQVGTEQQAGGEQPVAAEHERGAAGEGEAAGRDSNALARLLLFTPEGPLLVELEITVDGRPFRTARQKLIDHLMRAADADGNGRVFWDELFDNTWQALGRAPEAVLLGMSRKDFLRSYDLNQNRLVDADEAERLVCDERVRLVSFTGSARVGWRLRAVAGPKPVLLELGGSAPVIVCADADLERAARRCAAGAFAFSGQVCISVQRILVDRAVFEPFAARLTAEVRALRAGDPASEETDYGPMTTEREAERIGEWLQEAIAGGARVLAGGGRKGLMVDATVLTQVPRDCRIWKEEAFGPVVCVEPYTHFDEALELANDGAYGLQAGIFTSEMPRVLRAFDSLQFGGVVWNDVPTYRADNMPYGGIRSSGLGREGVRYAIQEMTHLRLLALAP